MATAHLLPVIPIITVDGPSASGKGTVSREVSRTLHFHYLDSGLFYRIVGYGCLQHRVDLSDGVAVTACMKQLHVQCTAASYLLDGVDVSTVIRRKEVGDAASKIAIFPQVREHLLEKQRCAAIAPGLVADGRDMGTVVFPHAQLKIFLTASVVVRAHRQYRQNRGGGSYASNVQNLQERDRRDEERALSPLTASEGALLIDSSHLNTAEVLEIILQKWYSLSA